VNTTSISACARPAIQNQRAYGTGGQGLAEKTSGIQQYFVLNIHAIADCM